jgi:hypothetical protein
MPLFTTTTCSIGDLFMIIERNINGKVEEIELTDDELFKAYKEQQLDFTIQDIVLEFGSQGYECKEISKLEDQLKEMAEEVLDNLDYNVPYNNQIEYVVERFV